MLKKQLEARRRVMLQMPDEPGASPILAQANRTGGARRNTISHGANPMNGKKVNREAVASGELRRTVPASESANIPLRRMRRWFMLGTRGSEPKQSASFGRRVQCKLNKATREVLCTLGRQSDQARRPHDIFTKEVQP